MNKATKDEYCIEKASPIWGKCEGGSDQYLFFRKRFLVSRISEEIFLEISANSTYEICLNQKRIPIQQVADFPDLRTFSHISISSYLKDGENQIEVEVHYMGDDFLTIQRGIPYLQLVIADGDDLYVKTDGTWEVSSRTGYASGLNQKMTRQLGYVFEYDSRKADHTPDMTAQISSVAGTLSPRQVPQLMEFQFPTVTLTACGIFKRSTNDVRFAWNVTRDFCAPLRVPELFSAYDKSRVTELYVSCPFLLTGKVGYQFKSLEEFPDADGFYVIIDLGRETAGYLTFSVEAPEGTILDIANGEHLADGRVRAYVGERHFTDRYHCKQGVNQFTYRHRRIGARYLEMHISRMGKEAVILHYLGLIPLEIPLPQEAEFHCEDTMIEAQRRLAIRTLNLCMHEHYEDCPWREQGLYAYDSRNQMLFGYYVWGNYDFAAASLDLLGHSYDGERYLALTAPGRLSRSIPVFTMAWIAEIWEHALFSGSRVVFDNWRGQIDQILEHALKEPVPGYPDLYCSGDAEKVWNFCEWRGVLSRLDTHPQMIYNLYLSEALRAASQLHQFFGNASQAKHYEERAEAIVKAAERLFYNEKKGGYDITLGDSSDSLYEHAQILMLLHGCKIISAQKRNLLLDLLEKGNVQPFTLSAVLYFLRAMLVSGERGEEMILPRLKKIFNPMLLSGATSLWETDTGADDFDGAGSLCHAWSAVYPYFCGRILAGVRPLEPGFKSFEVNPRCCGLTRATGEIPTPEGKIVVSWQKGLDGQLTLRIEKTAGLKCVVGDHRWNVEIVNR